MSSACPRLEAVLTAAAAALALAGCQREERDYHGPPPPTAAEAGVSPTRLHVGGKPQAIPVDSRAAKYEGVAFHISEGKRYYEWYNCYGCHASGGGDIGPPFIDDRWRYGGEISQIHASIVEGRPNGMPSFRGYIPDEQVWQIAAYVRSMSGNASKTAASSRGDEMKTGAPLTQVDKSAPQPVAPLDQPGQ